MIVVVGGQARNVGKTTVMCEIIAATQSLGWVAVKLTTHVHDASAYARATDTERYVAAGAREALLLDCASDLPVAANLIVESNAVVKELKPDLFVFVTDSTSAEWKASAVEVVSAADVVVERQLGPETLCRILGILMSSPKARE